MEIKRDVYLNRLIERKQNGLIKVITGIRRCGKSYLLNTLFYNHIKSLGIDESHIIKFAFDSNLDLITKIDDSFKKIVITGDMSPTYYNDDGVLFMNIFDFLLKPENLNM